MKYIIMLAAMLLIGMSSNNVQAQNNEKDNFLVQVDGLGCPFCAYGLEKKFKEWKGLKNPKIDMETGNFTFTYPATQKLTIAAIQKQVEAAGYTPVSVVINRADGSVETTKKEVEVTKKTTQASQKATITVAGNCDMCKARIEKAANAVKGVQNANWDNSTQQLTLLLSNATSVQTVEQAIAKAGHDTPNAKASDKTYDNLHGCCQYPRLK